jgi:hypothetical protein
MAWADVARVVGHGGTAWLLQQIAAKNLLPFAQGLTLRRVRRRNLPTIDSPRVAKCTFHDGHTGCTIPATHRPATCNYYVCESVFEHATDEGHAGEVLLARAVHEALVQKFVAWDAHLDAFVKATYPNLRALDGPTIDGLTIDGLTIDGLTIDEVFLADLVREFEKIKSR